MGFGVKSKSDSMQFQLLVNSMHPSRYVSYQQAQVDASIENTKVSLFLTDRSMLQSHNHYLWAEVSRLTLTPLATAARETIGVDSSKQQRLAPHFGEDYPSLQRDLAGLNVAGASGRNEFMIDFEKEILNNFQIFDKLFPFFEKIGQDSSKLGHSMLDSLDNEKRIFDDKIHPHPRGKLGFKEKFDYNTTRIMARKNTRLVGQQLFNERAEIDGSYLRIRFIYKHEVVGGAPSMDQMLVFTFPTSDQEKKIFEHTFWGALLPEDLHDTPLAAQVKALRKAANE